MKPYKGSYSLILLNRVLGDPIIFSTIYPNAHVDEVHKQIVMFKLVSSIKVAMNYVVISLLLNEF